MDFYLGMHSKFSTDDDDDLTFSSYDIELWLVLDLPTVT